MHMQTAPALPQMDEMAVARLERLCRQTSLVALETVLEVGEDGLLGRNISSPTATARNVCMHIIRASLEMQQAVHMTG